MSEGSLIRSPEPIRWERASLGVQSVSRAVAADIPGDFKLIAAGLGATDPMDESVTVLTRNAGSIKGHRIEWRPLPDSTTPDPAWASYYQFANTTEPLLSDGTQVIVYSEFFDGSNAPEREPGTLQRFVATTLDDATVRFTSPGVELRLVEVDGTIVNQLQFLTGESFAPLDMSAIRNADSTALCLFLAPGTALPADLSGLRLTFTFYRDAGADLPVWKRSGSDTAETVILTVPTIVG